MITDDIFGHYQGRTVHLYTLTNKNGITVSITNYGATIVQLIVPDREGRPGDVVLGFQNFHGYLQEANPYFGCIVGRYANRIADGSFELYGRYYQLARNNNGNSLHGGNKGFDKQLWDTRQDNGRLSFNYTSKDGEEGYPGELRTEVTYELTDNDELIIHYHASTSAITPVNLTNHAYFNLSAGDDPTILDHRLMINADHYIPVNEVQVPTGEILPVITTPMDFTTSKSIGDDIQKVAGGYDHCWVLNKDRSLSLAATLNHPASGRTMDVFTTQPGVQFYSGNFLDGSLKHTKNDQRYERYAGLCLETQHFPDSPNQPSFPSTILHAEQTYRHTTVHRFYTQ